MTGFNILQGDCLDVIPTLDDRSIDSIVTDPPYGLSFMGKDWDHGVPGVHFWVEALRVAKPGAFLLAFGGTRTFHRLVCAIEDAGWEIRDTIGWIYGSGFPKSLDVSKAIDKSFGVERTEIVGKRHRNVKPFDDVNSGWNNNNTTGDHNYTAPATEAARKWEGWGTALKPAWEPIIVARKPIIGTVAANVLKYGTGAMNIDASRIGTKTELHSQSKESAAHNGIYGKYSGLETQTVNKGRFPANIIHDGSDEVLAVFPNTNPSNVRPPTGKPLFATRGRAVEWNANSVMDTTQRGMSDNGGSAARFFYCAKASKQDRDEGCGELPLSDCGMMEDDNYPIKTGSGNLRETKRHNNHPTVKPTNLMRYLCKLVTPPVGLSLTRSWVQEAQGKRLHLKDSGSSGLSLKAITLK